MIGVSEYQAAWRDHDRACRALGAIALRLREIGREIEALNDNEFDEDRYPSAQAVQAALRARHETGQHLRELWALLGEDQRIGMSPPRAD